jgi:VWFA-related protein
VAGLSFIVAIVVILSPSLVAQAPPLASLVSTDVHSAPTTCRSTSQWSSMAAAACRRSWNPSSRPRQAWYDTFYDALYVTLRGFADAPPTDVRRRAIVVLTDGEDTTSVVSYDDVLDLAKRSAIAVYTITFDDIAAMNHRRFSTSAFEMRHLAEQTGALSFFATGAAEVRAIYESIALELSSQYAIGYTSQNASLDGGWRRVIVQVMNRPGVRARSRQGYYAIPGVDSFSSLLRH